MHTHRGHDNRTAIAMTSATAGRAILFSGLTVVAGLTGMLFFNNTGLPSLGWGGICATLVALTSSVILLPSVLAILGDKINFGRVPFTDWFQCFVVWDVQSVEGARTMGFEFAVFMFVVIEDLVFRARLVGLFVT